MGEDAGGFSRAESTCPREGSSQPLAKQHTLRNAELMLN